MWKLTLVLFHLICSALVAVQRSNWQTLSGKEPTVIARGGFSGLFPDSSVLAYSMAVQTGLTHMHVWCDVQLTKDGAGICFPDIQLSNASDIDNVYPNKKKRYVVNGASMQGYFSLDFTLEELEHVNLKRRINSRPTNFNGPINKILTVESVVSQTKPPGLWLNIPYDAFFLQHNLSMRSFILSVSRHISVNYVSSPEVGFLKSIASQFRIGQTKLVFQFLGPDDVEPTTNQTYGSFLNNLSSIQTFAIGILVPKNYIYRVENQYIQNHTSLVLEAHSVGLEVHAYDFANDIAYPYDFGYDPVSEYLSYIDNGEFSVDGVLSDFPITASESIDCFAHMSKNDTEQVDILVISSEGASGVYPGCSDKAYEKAVSDGVDVLDCPVQMSSDGIPFCLGSINLRDRTNAIASNFTNLATDNPQLGIVNGIFTYSLNWSQIQSLKPAIYRPYAASYELFRNPRDGNVGKLMQLSDFLEFAKNASSVSGVLISIENAAYLAEKQGLDVINAVVSTLGKSGYDNNQKAKTTMVMSSDSALLSQVKSIANYDRVYLVHEIVSDILNSTITAIKKFATAVVIGRGSVFPADDYFLTAKVTNIVPKLQAFNLSVYVRPFRNEYISLPWDFLSDPYVQINTYVSSMGINGVITDFPGTSARYKRNRCLGYKKIPIYMSPVQPGGLLKMMPKEQLPPAEAPEPVLMVKNVTEPPLPPVVKRNSSTAPAPAPPNGQPTQVATLINLSTFAVILLGMFY